MDADWRGLDVTVTEAGWEMCSVPWGQYGGRTRKSVNRELSFLWTTAPKTNDPQGSLELAVVGQLSGSVSGPRTVGKSEALNPTTSTPPPSHFLIGTKNTQPLSVLGLKYTATDLKRVLSEFLLTTSPPPSSECRPCYPVLWGESQDMGPAGYTCVRGLGMDN